METKEIINFLKEKFFNFKGFATLILLGILLCGSNQKILNLFIYAIVAIAFFLMIKIIILISSDLRKTLQEGKFQYGNRLYSRSETPLHYWLYIALRTFLALSLLHVVAGIIYSAIKIFIIE